MTDITLLDPSEADADVEITAPVEVDPKKPMRLYLVDGSGYIFRAFHALPPLTRKSDGLPVGAVSGFCNMLWKLICDTRDGDRRQGARRAHPPGRGVRRQREDLPLPALRPVQGPPPAAARRPRSPSSR